MKILAIILIALLFPLRAYGDFEFLPKGTPSLYDGYLITPEREKKFRLLDKELEVQYNIVDSMKKLDTFNNQQIDTLTKRVELYQRENTTLADTLAKKNSNTFWENTLFFMLGVVITGGIAIGLSKTL